MDYKRSSEGPCRDCNGSVWRSTPVEKLMHLMCGLNCYDKSRDILAPLPLATSTTTVPTTTTTTIISIIITTPPTAHYI